MDKFRYGTKEIIATAAGALLIVAGKALVAALSQKGIMPDEVFGWYRQGVLIIAGVAVFFGPISSLLCALSGYLLVNAIFGQSVGYPEIFVMALYGFFIGLYFGKMHYEPEKFSFRTVLDMNAVQIMAGIFAELFVIPFVRFLAEDISLYDGIMSGAKKCSGNIVIVGILCPVMMLAVWCVLTARNKRRRT